VENGIPPIRKTSKKFYAESSLPGSMCERCKTNQTITFFKFIKICSKCQKITKSHKKTNVISLCKFL
jgi:hypothetical protein